MPRRARIFFQFCLALVSFWLAGTHGVRAQGEPDTLIGRTVASVRLERLGETISDARLTRLVETRTDAPLSMRDVRNSVLHLFNTGLFEDVTVSATPESPDAGAKVALVYRLVPARTITRYDFKGELGLSENDLRKLLIERYGGRPAIGRVQGAQATIEAHYKEAGYLNARISSSIEPITAETVAFVLTVTSGARAKIGKIDVRGTLPPEVSSSESLPARLDLVSGRPFDGPALQRRVSRLVQDLRNRGYYEAAITPTQAPQEDGQVVDLELDVEAGPRVSLRVEGSAIPESRQDDLVPVRREGSIDEDLLEDSKRRIEQYLRSRGHARADVTYARRPTQTGLDLVFTVREGAIFRVGTVQVTGDHAIARTEIDSVLGVHPNDLFVEGDVDAKTNALVERYRRQGFRQVKIEQVVADRDSAPAGKEAEKNTSWVDVRLTIAEGPQTKVGTITVRGNKAVDEGALREALGLRPAGPFYEPQIASDRETIQGLYLNRGFDRVQVDVTTVASPDNARADLTFIIRENAQLIVDRILIVGNRRTDTATIEKAITIKAGEPLGLAELFESQRRLSALGLFRRVRITDVGEPGETSRDVIVTVDEAPTTTIGYGAGLEAGRRLGAGVNQNATEKIDFAGRGFFEVSRRNLFGSNRVATLFTRASLRPKDDPETNDTSFGFNEYRVLATLRDPAIFGTAVDWQVSGYFEQAVRSSFNFRRRGVQSQWTERLKRHFTIVGSYSFSTTELYDERISEEDRPDIDRLFPQVRLSIFSAATRRDTRDDVLDPKGGTVLGLDTDVAMRAVGSEVGFMKGFGEVFWYRQVPQMRRAVFATGVRVGLARGFERSVVRVLDGVPVTDPAGNAIIDTVTDLPASERFFAGGDTTVRGFARDTLGDPDTLVSGFPRGGNAMIILNGELRVPVWGDFGSVVFVDAGNVFRRVSDAEFSRLRPTAGFGVRYKSPIGPIRVDLGFKLDRGRFDIAGRQEPLTEIHISIGQAF
jgi:outer membrane protein assembly complex protein YaeT